MTLSILSRNITLLNSRIGYIRSSNYKKPPRFKNRIEICRKITGRSLKAIFMTSSHLFKASGNVLMKWNRNCKSLRRWLRKTWLISNLHQNIPPFLQRPSAKIDQKYGKQLKNPYSTRCHSHPSKCNQLQNSSYNYRKYLNTDRSTSS